MRHPFAWSLFAAAVAFVLRLFASKDEREQDWEV